jgi:hypothetical protein
MTTFDPSISAHDHPDHLSGALQQGLPRPMHAKLTWSVVRTFLLGGITGGIVPVYFLPKRFRDFAKAEQLQFWHLAEWLRLQTGDTEAAAATDAAKRVMPGRALRLASLAFLIVAIGIACTALQHTGPLVPRWLDLTLPEVRLAKLQAEELRLKHDAVLLEERHRPSFDNEHRFPGSNSYFYSPSSPDNPQKQWRKIYRSDDQRLYSTDNNTRYSDNSTDNSTGDDASSDTGIPTGRASTIAPDLTNAFALAMGGAALCWLIEINTHVARVRRFVGAFNQLSGRYGVGAVRPPGVQLGLRPLWILGAAATCALGGFWAAPVMLAAAAQRRYIKSTSQRLRTDLARRQRDVLLARRPTLRVPASTHLLGICPRENCRAPYPPEAAYCRRCGTKFVA